MYSVIELNEKCSYTSSKDGWSCQEPSWQGSRHGFCIGHAREWKKPFQHFLHFIQRKLQKRDYNFDGFVFPFCLTLKNISTSKSISFQGCTFLQGCRIENLDISGSLISFEDCTFRGPYVYFNQCHLNAAQVRFDRSLFEGELVAFNHCHFRTETTSFAHVKFHAHKRIAFAHCHFQNGETVFDAARLQAPVVSFQNGSWSSSLMQFLDTEIRSDKFSFSNIHQTQGDLVFNRTQFHCGNVGFKKVEWDGQSVQFTKCRWSGQKFSWGHDTILGCDLSVKHCQFEGRVIDLSHFQSTSGTIDLHHNRFFATQAIDLTRIAHKNKLQILDNVLKSPRVLLDQLRSHGDFLFQRNTVTSDLFSCTQSEFVADHTSFTRSKIQSRITDFSRSLYRNYQTSFQGMHVEGERADFSMCRFLSERTSFNLAQFDLDCCSMESVNFGRGNTSFWKTDLSQPQFSLRDATNENGRIRFSCRMDHIFWAGSRLTGCDFEDSLWNMQGWRTRPVLGDESELIQSSQWSELKRLYQWISQQYASKRDARMSRLFTRAYSRVQRMESFYQSSGYLKVMQSPYRWATSVGAAVLVGILAKGLASVLSILSMTRLK